MTIRLDLYPDPAQSTSQALNALMDALEASAKTTPSHFGPAERSKLSYSRQAVLDSASNFPGMIHLYRDKALKYHGYFAFEKFTRPYLSMDFGKTLSSSQWNEVQKLSDLIASKLNVQFGILHVLRSGPFPWTNEEEKLQRWMTMAVQPIPARYAASGPLGLGSKTYFGGDILEIFGEERLLSTPGASRKLGKGCVCIDLVKDALNISVPELALQWKAAMHYLAPAQGFATPIFDEDCRTVEFEPSPQWRRLLEKSKP